MEEDRDPELVTRAEAELEQMPGLPAEPSLDVFKEPFRCRNHMAILYLSCEINGSEFDIDGKTPNALPLLQVWKRIDNAFFVPWASTAMLMFSMEVKCTALVYANGPMIVTGGSTLAGVRHSISHFFGFISKAVAQVKKDGNTYACKVREPARLRNIVFTNKASGYCNDIVSLQDHALTHGWSHRLHARQINILTITPFPRTLPSLVCNIIPAGGLVLIPEFSSGCSCAYPIQTSVAFRPAGGD